MTRICLYILSGITAAFTGGTTTVRCKFAFSDVYQETSPVRNETLKLGESRRSRSKLVELLRSWASKPKFWFLPDDDWREQVQAAVKRLPPEQAEVVVLKIWEEMTFAEIAEVLGESLNTTASRYRYALEKLSRSLQPLAEEVLHG